MNKKVDKFCKILNELQSVIIEFSFISDSSFFEVEGELVEIYKDEFYDTSVKIKDDLTAIVYQQKKSPKDMPELEEEYLTEFQKVYFYSDEHSWELPKSEVEDRLIAVFKRRVIEYRYKMEEGIKELSSLKIPYQTMTKAFVFLKTIYDKNAYAIVGHSSSLSYLRENFKKFTNDLELYILECCDPVKISDKIEELQMEICIEMDMPNQRELEPEGGKACIEKGPVVTKFCFNNGVAEVPNGLNGLVLIEFLLTHPQIKYTALELLKAVGQRGMEETESEKIYSKKDIIKIKESIEGLKGRLGESTDSEDKLRFEQLIKDAEAELYKTRNYKGDSRKFSEKYTKSVTRNTKTVLARIAKQHILLSKHFEAFLKVGELCSYKPDSKIIWEIL